MLGDLRLGLTAACVLLIGASGCDPGGAPPGRDGGGTESGLPPSADADGDGISDVFEGRSGEVDTDGDGIPDYLDTDSDGDGIPDSVEGGRPGGEPLDSDGDGTPDFRDLDSDDNGILDANEGDGDTDGDGIPDFRDGDDDGDGLGDRSEIGDPAAPTDTDGDGIPDYLDTDSDNDTIGDVHEGVADTDGDGILDRFDLDSDGDGIPDSVEAGDADISTPPRDTDGDTIPDFRDPDSDGDGLSDADEIIGGTNPFNSDTDGDGVSDLVEVAAGTDPTDPGDSPRTRGDFVFLVPFEMPPDPTRDTLDFATDIQDADIYFLMDETGSMGSSIASLADGISGIIPRIRAVIPNTWFGLGGFRDYPVGGYGGGADLPFENYLDITNDTAAVMAAASSSYEPSGGADRPESHTQAIYAAVTGNSLSPWVSARSGCPSGTFGYPCFRSTAVPIIVLISDVDAHNGPSVGPGPALYSGVVASAIPYSRMVSEATAARVRVTGIWQGSYTGGRDHLQQIARDTNAVDGAGAPLVEQYTGGAIGDAVVRNIQTLAAQTPFDISAEFIDDPSDAVDTAAAFLDHLEANTGGDAARMCDPRAAEDRTGDGFNDTFPGVLPGNRVCFDIIPKMNTTVMPTDMPQIFRAEVRVLGDGFTELDRRDVFFLVPPTPPEIMGPD